jgi:hypothetical protein
MSPHKWKKFGHRGEHHVDIKVDWGVASTSQGTPNIASEGAEARRGVWNKFSLTVLRRNQPLNTLILDF